MITTDEMPTRYRDHLEEFGFLDHEDHMKLTCNFGAFIFEASENGYYKLYIWQDGFGEENIFRGKLGSIEDLMVILRLTQVREIADDDEKQSEAYTQ